MAEMQSKDLEVAASTYAMGLPGVAALNSVPPFSLLDPDVPEVVFLP